MNLAEKLDNIAQTSTLMPLPNGRAVDLDAFWRDFIEPRLPAKEIVEQWHNILMQYVADDAAIFTMRAFGNWENQATKDDKTLRRGFLNLTNTSIRTMYVDNFFTSYFFAMAYDGYVPKYADFKNMMISRRFPAGAILTPTERARAAFTKYVNAQISTNGYKIAHIYDSARNFATSDGIDKISVFCKKYFPRGEYDDWNQVATDEYGTFNYRHVDLNLTDVTTVRAFLVAHFLRTVHPINYFLVPNRGHILFMPDNSLHDEIGEYPPLIKYVQNKIKQRYGTVYDEFLRLILPADTDCMSQENMVLCALYGLGLKSGGKKNTPTQPAATTTQKPRGARIVAGKSGIGQRVKQKLIPALTDGRVSDDEIKKLQTGEYSKATFDINYPLLAKERFDTNGRPRYYATPVQIDGAQWYVCQEWFDRSNEKLSQWLKSHNAD